MNAKVLREIFDWACIRDVEVVVLPPNGEEGYVMKGELLRSLNANNGSWGEGISFLIREKSE